MDATRRRSSGGTHATGDRRLSLRRGVASQPSTAPAPQAPPQGGAPLGRLAHEAIDAVLVIAGLVFLIGGLTAALSGCSPMQRSAAEHAAVSAGKAASNCALGAGWTCAGAVMGECGAPDVLSAASWGAWYDCASAVGPECAAARALDCAGLAITVAATATSPSAANPERATITAGLSASRSVQAAAEACIASETFRAGCQGPETCQAALAECIAATIGAP